MIDQLFADWKEAFEQYDKDIARWPEDATMKRIAWRNLYNAVHPEELRNLIALAEAAMAMENFQLQIVGQMTTQQSDIALALFDRYKNALKRLKGETVP